MELKLWHVCFHMPVQEFRRRIAAVEAKGDKGREALAKVLTTFLVTACIALSAIWTSVLTTPFVQLKKSFAALLADAVAFYKAFAMKLQLVYGSVGFKLSVRDYSNLAQQLTNYKPAEQKLDMRAPVQRCLVCLGDLTRWLQCVHRHLLSCHASAMLGMRLTRGGESCLQV